MQYKNTPKIKVLQMPCKFNMIFSGIFENIWHWEHGRGSKHLATRVQGAPRASWAHGGSPPLITAPTHFFFLPKKSPSSSSTSSSSFCYDFRSPCWKHLSQNCFGDCSLVCDSSIGPISFCSSALFIANLCCLGDHVLELACQIYMVPSSSNAWYSL